MVIVLQKTRKYVLQFVIPIRCPFIYLSVCLPKGRMAAIMWLHKLISCQYLPAAGKLQN